MLLGELEGLFANAAYPGDRALGAPGPNEWEPTLRRLRGVHWRQVTVDHFNAQGGVMEGVQALSLKGFLYFLPGLARIALIQSNERYGVVSALLSQFTHPDYPESPLEDQQKIIASLSGPQREFLIRFFAYMREAEPHLCPVLVDSAISNLEHGQVSAYTHRDVLKWAESGGH